MEQSAQSPALANAAVVLGFVVLLSVFATDSPWSVILGVGIVVAGGLWAGLAGEPVGRASMAVAGPSDATDAPADTAATTLSDHEPEDERDDGHTA